MNILVINAGSSSLKFQLIHTENEEVICKGLFERIGMEDAVLIYEARGQRLKEKKEAVDHEQAIAAVLEALLDEQSGVISDLREIDAVGHRIVHGGERFGQPVLIDDAVISAIEENISLAPLHNPANITGIEACRKHMPDVPMVGVFDTSYHHTMPKKAFLYAIPMEAYEKYKIRRFGFHGTSHHYVVDKAAETLGKDVSKIRIISCHLGNGASVAAIKYGKVIDTSMGFSPLGGVAMGTRSGDIDPSALQYLTKHMGISMDEGIEYLNKRSGVLGISGISSDFRDLFDAMDAGNENARLAIEIFCYRIKKYIGAYVAAMGDVDTIVFTAGIGENSPKIREMVIDGMDFLGVRLNRKNNENNETIISEEDSKVTVMRIRTNEELMIARVTQEICNG